MVKEKILECFANSDLQLIAKNCVAVVAVLEPKTAGQLSKEIIVFITLEAVFFRKPLQKIMLHANPCCVVCYIFDIFNHNMIPTNKFVNMLFRATCRSNLFIQCGALLVFYSSFCC